MRKIIFYILAAAAAFMLFSCGGRNPAAPQPPAGTATATLTNTPYQTATITATASLTASVTLTATVTSTATVTHTRTPAIKLNLAVKRDASDPFTGAYLDIFFRVSNHGDVPISLDRLQIKAWFETSGTSIVDVRPSCTIYDQDGFFAGTLDFSLVDASLVYDTSSACVDALDRKKNTDLNVSFVSAQEIPAGGMLETTVNFLGLMKLGALAVFDQERDDYSKVADTADYSDNMHFGLYLDGGLVQEWESPAFQDSRTGREPCTWPYPTLTVSYTATQTRTITFTVTYTETLTPTPTVTNTSVTADFYPVKDTFTNSFGIYRDYGSCDTLDVYKSAAMSEYRRVYMAFDLSAIPASAVVTAATLRIYYLENAANMVIYADAVSNTQNWIEGTWCDAIKSVPQVLTYENAPAYDSLKRLVTFTTPSGPGSITKVLDTAATLLVQEWISNQTSNQGVVFWTNDDGLCRIDSRDSPVPGGKPRLSVTYR